MSRRPRVLALVIDGANHEMLHRWIAQGELPVLRRLQERSTHHMVVSSKKFSNEYCWIPLLTGLGRDRFDHWLDHWNPRDYQFNEASIFDWLKAPVFYALGEQRRVIAFDLAAPVVDGVDGMQVTGWASELNESMAQSRPPRLLQELLDRHGADPKIGNAIQVTNALSQRAAVSHVLPTMYDTPGLIAYAQDQIHSVERRTAAALDLMSRGDWDLFFGSYSESHTAGHLHWHLSEPHPLDVLATPDAHPMLRVFQAVDASIGRLMEEVGEDDHVVVFTLDSMAPDALENARALLLPEFMYRWNFAGQAAIAAGDPDAPVPPQRLDYREHWKHEVWKLRTSAGERDLESPSQQQARGDAMNWCPANWYRAMWPKMRAFALPTVADGYIRINVIGREAEGQVAPGDFAAVCAQLKRDIAGMKNARTGEPMVREVIQVRESPFDDDPTLPPGDLIVIFSEATPIDTVDSPIAGRIGPVPYFRTGSHPAHGTLLRNSVFVQGPSAKPGEGAQDGRLEDIPATLLSLMGLPVPASFDGKPLA